MICFVWSGFPQYAARCVGAFVRSTKLPCCVVATRPKVPIMRMEELCGCPVHWIDDGDSIDIEKICGEIPDIGIISGWGFSPFNIIRDQIKQNGGRVYAISDNNFQFSIKEIIKALRFRFLIKGRYDGFMVPGNSGYRLLRFYGVSPKRLFKGLYSADATLFMATKSLSDRPKKIIYVGQLCDRKNIVEFSKAFLSIPSSERVGWSLEICGCGPDRDLIPNDGAIIIRDFVQPEKLAEVYQTARIFALPSKEEHWGVVVHEAALSGCMLLLSRQVGAAHDFMGNHNGKMFNAYSERQMKEAIEYAIHLDDNELKIAEDESLKLASGASLDAFVANCRAMIGV